MDRPLITTPAHVRAVIARHVLGAPPTPTTLGDVHLHPHQAEAVGRVRTALAEFGGALLCDEVGLGKTFVALAVATSYESVRIVAPAVLREMWLTAATQAHVEVHFTSIESLARAAPHTAEHTTPPSAPLADVPQLVIVDEAHHARNPATKRYAALATLCATAHTLLLTATPIHNTRADLDALLALPLGTRTRTLPPDALGRLVIRRAEHDTAGLAARPRVSRTHWLTIPTDDAILDTLLALPPPLPPRGGGNGGTLVIRTLVHQWASSDAALLGALRRRVARATAMLAALDEGRHPSVDELRAWTYADDAVQLAFPTLLAPATSDAATLAATVRTHADALRALITCVRGRSRTTPPRPEPQGRPPAASPVPPCTAGDVARATLLRRIRRRHAGARIVAFSRYGDTVATLYRALRHEARVAALTTTGGVVAGGTLTRAEVLARFAPESHSVTSRACDDVTLLLATDLLSEGVNLQDASVVVHLDIPWTVARLRQRVGRVARLGSRHARVTVYAFRPPERAERLLRMRSILRAKADTACRAIGETRTDGRASLPPTSIPEHVEATRRIITAWSSTRDAAPAPPTPVAAAVHADARACLAACRIGTRPVLLAAVDSSRSPSVGSPTFTADPIAVYAAARLAASRAVAPLRATVLDTHLVAVRAWHDRHRAATTAGAEHATSVTPATRARHAIIRQLSRTRANEPLGRRLILARAMTAAYQRLGEPLPAGAERALVVAARSGTLPGWCIASRHDPTDALGDIRVLALLVIEPAGTSIYSPPRDAL